MKLSAKVPVIFRAKPSRARDEKDVFVSETRTFEIREASPSEMTTVFETDSAYAYSKRSNLHDAVLGDARSEVRSLEGKLFRPLASLREIADLGLADYAFPNQTWLYPVSFRSEISFVDHRSDDRLRSEAVGIATPLFAHFRWRLMREELAKRRLGNFWPSNGSVESRLPFGHAERGAGAWWHKNAMELSSLMPGLREWDQAGLDHSRHLADALMDSFVIVDDCLWERCVAPVYKVQWVSGQIRAAVVTIVHPPRWQDTNLVTQYFPITDKDAAVEYADALVRSHALNTPAGQEDQRPYGILDHTVPFEVADFDSLPHCEGSDEVFRFSCAVAAENRRFLSRNPAHAARFDDDDVAGAFASFEEVRRTNYVTGEYGDPTEWLDSNIDIWTSTGRHQSTYGFNERFVSDMLIGRARALMDDRPIFVSPMGSPRL